MERIWGFQESSSVISSYRYSYELNGPPLVPGLANNLNDASLPFPAVWIPQKEDLEKSISVSNQIEDLHDAVRAPTGTQVYPTSSVFSSSCMAQYERESNKTRYFLLRSRI